MLSPLESAEGILVTAAIRDITARKKAEAHLLKKVEELNRSNEELGQFAYIASHDLQEPLRMVASYTQLLSGDTREAGRRRRRVHAFAVDGANRMQRLIQDLLAYSRVGTKGQELAGNLQRERACSRRSSICATTIEESGAMVTHDPFRRAGGRNAAHPVISKSGRQRHQIPEYREPRESTSLLPETAEQNGCFR